MRASEFLTESTKLLAERKLEKVTFGPEENKQIRIQNFIKLYSTPNPEDAKLVGPFTLTNGQPIWLKREPAILKQLKSLTTYDYLNFPSKFTSADGRPVPLSSLEKTKVFGGDSKIDNPMGKQALPVKPSDIGIVAQQIDPDNKKEKFDVDRPDVIKVALQTGAFAASELPSKIQSDNILRSNPVGLKIIEMSKQISQGIVPDMPSRKEMPNTAIAAIRDYAGEYLGVQQLVQGIANFPNSDAFYDFMDTGPAGLGNLMLYFPKSTNSPLADSLAITEKNKSYALQNTQTGHVIKLSAKGNKEGAPPSMDNLKVPDFIRKKKNKNIQQVVKFLDIAHSSGAKDQPFKLAEFFTVNAPDSMPDSIKELFPILPEEFNRLYATKRDPSLPCPQKFKKLANIKGQRGMKLSGTHYGRVHYQINKALLSAVNEKNALPGFRKTVLEILGYNFVQIFSRERQGKLFADVLWPATVNGQVEMYSKSSSSDPEHQKLSFSVKD
jgi:hypothetical protein